MAEWSIASDLKSDELNRFREFESHSLLYKLYLYIIFSIINYIEILNHYYSSVTSITTPLEFGLSLGLLFPESKICLVLSIRLI